MSDVNFQYCQKIVLFNENDQVLLARRKGEADYDGVYSFIGGKMETDDGGLLEGIRREKNEEIGTHVKILVAPYISFNAYFTKKDGNAMVLPHVYAIYQNGEIELNEEYSEYQWVDIGQLKEFQPKIHTIPEAVSYAKKIRQILTEKDLFEI